MFVVHWVEVAVERGETDLRRRVLVESFAEFVVFGLDGFEDGCVE